MAKKSKKENVALCTEYFYDKCKKDIADFLKKSDCGLVIFIADGCVASSSKLNSTLDVDLVIGQLESIKFRLLSKKNEAYDEYFEKLAEDKKKAGECNTSYVR